MDKIPFVDLKRQSKSAKIKIEKAIQSVIDDAAFISDKYPKIFEEQFAKYTGAKYCVATGSGTDSLFLSFAAIGIKKGDEVIIPGNTFTATSEPVIFFGATPVFADVDPQTHLISIPDIIKKITKKTKVIAPVHLYGQPAPMEEIMKIAQKRGIKVIEDCAHAQGAARNGKKVGTFGDLGAYSFNPTKVLGAYGDAGAIITNNEKYINFLRQFMNHGREMSNKYLHDFVGLNLRMGGMQAAILSAKLPCLEEYVKKRNHVASLYAKLLPKSVKIVKTLKGNRHAYHLFVIETDKRDELQKYLKEKGVETGIHYPVPLNLQKAYNVAGKKMASLPIAEKLAKKILSLPMFPEMKDSEVKRTAKEIKNFFLPVKA
jgi:dTDP-4-amino-4,6-dideoxygalactose transaminase